MGGGGAEVPVAESLELGPGDNKVACCGRTGRSCGLVGKKVRVVSRGKVVESFVGQKAILVFDAVGDREPAEFTEERGELVWVRSQAAEF